MSFDKDKPAASTSLKVSNPEILANNTALQDAISFDHDFEGIVAGTQTGKHNKMTLIETADLGTGAEGVPILGAQTTIGKAELVFTDEDDNDVIMTSNGGVAMPYGSIIVYGGSSAPTGWLLCDGTTGLSTTANPEYAGLFSVIGTTYGGGGATDFDLPDLRGRVAVGLDAAFVNTTTPTAGALNESTAGEENHALLETELADHTHPNPAGGGFIVSTNSVNADAVDTAGSGATAFAGSINLQKAGATGATGSDTAHNNMQPYLTLNYIIKF